MKWDDYKLVLAITREKRIAAAAASLNLTPSTVFRRLEKIEDMLQEPIFDRPDGIYIPSGLGRDFAAAAERMEQEVHQTQRAVDGGRNQLRGRLTITASEVLAPFFVARHIPQLAATHPGLEFEVIAGNNILSLASREADIALRPVRPTEESLYGRKIADIRWAIYGQTGSDLNAAKVKMVGFGGSQLAERTMKSQVQGFPETSVQVFSNSILLTAALAAQGKDLAVIPMVLGEQWPGLERLSDPLEHEFGELWIVCHKDLRNNARIRVVFDALIAGAKADTALFAGRT